MADVPPPPPGYTLQGGNPLPPPPGYTVQSSAPPPPPPPGYTIQSGVSIPPPGAAAAGVQRAQNPAAESFGESVGNSAGPTNPHVRPQPSLPWYADPLHAIAPDFTDTARAATLRAVHQGMEGIRGQIANPAGMAGSSLITPAAPLFPALQIATAPVAGLGAAIQHTLNPGEPATQQQLTGQQNAQDTAGQVAASVVPLPGAAEESASRGAAKLLDAATAAKTHFDVQQSLSGTGNPVARFVSDLFAKRGIDTTPQADPRTSQIAPMTGDHVALNAADHMQLQQLMKTGSVDDIKNFFQGRQGPQPSWSSVNRFVEQRDNPNFEGTPAPVANPRAQGGEPFNYNDQYNAQAEQQYREQNRQAVESHVNNQMAGWQNAPNVEVVHGPGDISDPAIRAQALQEDPKGNALGFLGSDGTVRMFSGRIISPEVSNAVLFHEGLGHFGLSQQFGARLDQVLTSLLDRNVNQFSRDTTQWIADHPGAYGGDRLRAAEEVLAERSQDGPVKSGIWDAVTSAVRNFGRKMGLNLAYSDAEVNHILAMSHDAVINGKPDASANGFRVSDAISNLQAVGAHGEINGNRFMRGDSEDRFRNLPINEINDWKNRGIHYLKADKASHDYSTDSFQNYLTQHPHLVGLNPDKVWAEISRSMMLGEPGSTEFGNSLESTDSVMQFFKDREAESQVKQTRVDRLISAKSIKDIRDNLPGHIRQMVDESTEGSGENWLDHPNNKYMTRDQLNTASQPGYHADDLEGIYHSLDEGYEPTVRPWEEDRQAALKAGFSPSQIEKLRTTNPGDLSTRLWRMQSAANLTDAKLADLHIRLDTPQWSEQDRADYIKTIADRNYLVQRITGERSEIARALNVSRAAGSYSQGTMDSMREILDQHGSGLASLAADPTAFLKFAKSVKELMENGNPDGAHVKLDNVTKPYWLQYLNTAHFNMMLSGLSTHVKAPTDMATGIIRNVVEKALAIPYGQARQMLMTMTGRTAKPGVEVAELANHIIGLTRAVSDAETYRASWNALRSGQSSYVIPTMDADGKITSNATPTNFANQYGAMSNPRLGGAASSPSMLGHNGGPSMLGPAPIPSVGGAVGLLNKPMDAVGAQDTFFRSVEMNAQLLTVATREAREQLGKGASTSDVMTLGHSLALRPTPTMLKEAFAETNRTLLLNDNPLNTLINRARTYRPGMNFAEQLGATVVTNLAPFIRVESNSLLNRVIQRSPLGLYQLFDPASELRMGGARGDIAATKIIYGTVLIGMMWAAADKSKDYLTGTGPNNTDKYKELLAGGWRPNAVHENGTYNTGGQLGMSSGVNPFDMHNRTAQTVAAMRQAYESQANQGQVASGLMLALGSLGQHLASQSWISDIDPLVSAVTAHGEEGQSVWSRAANNEAGTWVPNLFGQTARVTDPNQRDTNATGSPFDQVAGSLGHTLEAEVPGLRQSLPIKYSVYGDPLQGGSSWSGVHTPIGLSGNGTTETHDPAERELDRLNSMITGALITPVQHTIAKDPDDSSQGKLTLTPEQFEEYQRVAGRSIVYNVQQLMDNGQWTQMTDQDRVNEVKTIESNVKQDAADAIRERYYHQ